MNLCNPLTFSTLDCNATARVVRSLLDQHTLSGFTAVGFFIFYVRKYHLCLQRDDVPTGGVLCDSHLCFMRRVPNKLERFFGSPDCAVNKNAHPWIWSVMGKLFCLIFLLLWNFWSVGVLSAVGGPFILTYYLYRYCLLH